jgi:hypothetical protein
MADHSRRIMKQIGKPDHWMLYCGYCNFEHPPMVDARKQCPSCGEGMRIWDLSLGKRPRRRAI